MMRTLLTALLLSTGVAAIAGEPVAVHGKFTVEPQSVIRFSVAQVGGSAIEGTFERFSGSFDLDGDDLSRSLVQFSLSPDGVKATDPRVEDFIRSEAVFDVVRYPKVSFVSEKVTRTGPDSASIAGRLTAKGRTAPVTFTVTFKGRKGEMLNFQVKGKMSRALFNMDVGTPVFSNMVVLDMDLVGRKL
jgi:polyisoprenoid-binding protein YceI